MIDTKAPGMWFRRWRRRRHAPPEPVLLPPLDRLSELVERVVVLLDQAPTPAPVTQAQALADGHLLFVSEAAGYRLVARQGEPPAWGELLELDGLSGRVTRVGRSPLPGDRRPCAFLEQEPAGENRTPTRERGESDRRDEGGTPG